MAPGDSTSSNQHLLPLLLLFPATTASHQKQEIPPSEPPDYIRPVMSVRRLTSMWNDRTRNGPRDQTSPSRRGPRLAQSRNLRSGDFPDVDSSPPETPILPNHPTLPANEDEISPFEVTQNLRTSYISADARDIKSQDNMTVEHIGEDEESLPPPKITSVQEFGRQLSHIPSNESIPHTPSRHSQSPRQSRTSEFQGQQSAISGSTVVNPFTNSPSRISLPVTGRRTVSVEFPAPSCAATSTNVSPESPQKQNVWTYHESVISSADLRRPKHMVINSKNSLVDTASLSFDELRDIHIQSQRKLASISAEPEEYEQIDTHQRAQPAQLPRIITDLHGPGIFIAPDTKPSAAEVPHIETTPDTVNSEIRELKDELKKTARILESKIAAVAKDSVPASSASFNSPMTPGDISEYIEQPKVTRTNTQKSSPILFSPEVRAKKIIVMLDATHQYLKPIPKLRAKKTLKFPPRTNLKRLSDALASEHKENGMRQLVYYLGGRGTGDGMLLFCLYSYASPYIDIEFGVGRSLHTTILDAYTYISDNWSHGDEVYIFGFSHGALAARGLAALISDIGLFNKPGMENFEALYDTYFDPKYGKVVETDDFETWREAVAELAFEISEGEGIVLNKAGVKLLGCLDTIGWSDFQQEPSQSENERLWRKGYVSPRHLLLHEDIENAFHALALDEDRASHAPMLMFRPRVSRKSLTQVWFTGSHINIGGGQLSHEIASKVGFAKPNPNELSDIVFLWMITQCHEFLTFGKKHINKAVADYMSLQAGEDDKTTEGTYKDHWVAAKIDEAWPEKIGLFARVRQATGLQKRHVRTPLRYRPHWFKSEPWSRYVSLESIHASSRYRTKYHPTYIPKALVGYRSEKCIKESDTRNPTVTATEEAGQNILPKRFREINYHWEGEETLKDRIFTAQKSLPLTKMTAFEVLNAGGEVLVKGFGLSYKDLYRESPPVFKYTWQELRSMQESWVLKLEPEPGQAKSPINRPALKPANSLDLHEKYRGMKIKQENNTGTTKGKKFSKKASSSKDAESERTGSAIFGNSLLSNSSRVKTDKRLKDESDSRKEKGKHSGHPRDSLSFRRNDDKRKLSRSIADIAEQMQEVPSIVVKPPPQQHHHQHYQSEQGTRRQRYSGEEGQRAVDQAREFSKRGRGRYPESIRYTDDVSDDESLPPIAPLRIPVEPEWAKKMKEKGVVHPCKFKGENRE
ncbi:hypothetical protein TWF694_007843 [Orbilia ellipsospora]|uniref:T6SS Phospholipase effector Tle1-like catalytic domain-containing protein n=1 Tax=Orbilia ellipsospora TaxID=2528407 RepID=A0AAV9XJE1_9PEZI